MTRSLLLCRGGGSMTVLGIDLSASNKKPSTYLALDDGGEVSGLGSFKANDELVSILDHHSARLVAIGAPLSLPSGLCCLEESCSCSLVEGRKGRVAEEELASKGIGCFYTNKRSIIRKLIYRAIGLRNELELLGKQVIEAYPYATKVKLFNGKVPAKSNPESLMFLRKRLPELVGGLEPYAKDLNHDRCDAVLTAYTGRLSESGLTELVGSEEEGYITIPRGPATRNGNGSPNRKRPT